MRIQLLGTGGAEGIPGLFCRCDLCDAARERGGKDFRTRSTMLVDGVLKFDLPPDTLHHTLHCGLDMTKVRHLVFTHDHDDHYAPRELQYLADMFVSGEAPDPLEALGPASVLTRLAADVDLGDLPIEVRPLAPWRPTVVGDYEIVPILAQHDPSRECFNYVLSDGRARLLYATDTGWYADETWRYLEAERLDAIIVECSKGLENEGYSGHMSLEQVVEMRSKLLRAGALRQGARVVTTHHSHQGRLLHEDLQRRLEPHGIEAGYDGMRFDL